MENYRAVLILILVPHPFRMHLVCLSQVAPIAGVSLVIVEEYRNTEAGVAGCMAHCFQHYIHIRNRCYIEFTQAKGRVYSDWRSTLYTCKSFQVFELLLSCKHNNRVWMGGYNSTMSRFPSAHIIISAKLETDFLCLEDEFARKI